MLAVYLGTGGVAAARRPRPAKSLDVARRSSASSEEQPGAQQEDGGSAASAGITRDRTSGGPAVGVPWTGESGITETVGEIMERERLAPAIDTSQLQEIFEPESGRDKSSLKQFPGSLPVSQWPPSDRSAAAVEQILSPQTVGTSFFGANVFESGFVPPDTMGDVGPSQALVVVNGRIKVFDRNGTPGALNSSTNTFFNSVRNGSTTSDPHVRYDRLSGRWFVVCINVSPPNRVLIAVSSGPTIVDGTSFTFFQFRQDQVGPTPNSDTGGLADYPTLGVDSLALYVGVNVFNAAGNAFLGTTGFVINKADLIAGPPGTLTVTAFRQLAGPPTLGPYAPQGVDNDDPGSTEGYFIGVDNLFFGLIDVRRVSDPGGTPSISGDLQVPLPATSFPILVPHAGSSVRLDALDDRVFAASIHKNKITGASTLWTAHNIQVDATGASSTTGGRNGSRWYEIGDLTGAPTLLQSGTLFDTTATNPRFFWIPSVVMSGQGHMALGCSTAATNHFAEAAVAGRLSVDPLGTTQPFTLAQSSSTSYNLQTGSGQRWGDFTQTEVDPNDDMTIWTFQEYCDTTNSWGVRVIQLIAPPPSTPVVSTPKTVCPNVPSATVIITGLPSGGAGFFDPGPDTGGPGFANHVSASISGMVAVNSITFNDPTQVTLNVSTAGAACGPRNVTVTNPDGQSRTGTGLLSISPPKPVVSNNGPICSGQTLQLTSSTFAGSTYGWTGPDGFTSTAQSPSIPDATTAASGIYSVTRTGCGCTSASTTTATVKPTPAAPVASNSGPICEGANLQLTASTVAGATYSWTGPSGFTSTSQNPSIPNAPAAASGTYNVTVTVGGCASAPAGTSATVRANNGCDDGNACTENDRCVSGFCTSDPIGPSEVSNTVFQPDKVTLIWDAVVGAGPGTVYDVLRGVVSELPVGEGSSEFCLTPGGIPSTTVSDPTLPTAGDPSWYLVRSRSDCGAGSYGFRSNGGPRITGGCP